MAAQEARRQRQLSGAKRAYRRPIVVDYGPVASLTLGSPKSHTEGLTTRVKRLP
jgi:hypothetical protein